MSGDAESVRAIDGSFALVTIDGLTVRMARSLDRPMRYFLAKRHEGPALFVADRIERLHRALAGRRSRRAVPSELHADGAGALHRRARAGRLSRSRSDLHALLHSWARQPAAGSRRDRPALCRRAGAARSTKWLRSIDRADDRRAHRRELLGRHRQRLGVPADVSHHAAAGHGAGEAQGVRAGSRERARRANRPARFSTRSDSRCFSRRSTGAPTISSVEATLRVLEDYKPLDVECAAMGLLLCQGIRERYPGVAAPGRRRRRRREPEGLSDRGESRSSPSAASSTT